MRVQGAVKGWGVGEEKITREQNRVIFYFCFRFPQFYLHISLVYTRGWSSVDGVDGEGSSRGTQ